MRTRFHPALVLGFLLLGCEKPQLAERETAGLKSTKQTPARKAARREPKRDPAATQGQQLQAAEKIESPAERVKALAEIAWNAIETDPETAHEAFRKLPADSPEKLRLIQHYAMRLAEQNPGQAIEWASRLDTERESATATSLVALAVAEIDPLRAANLLSESGIAGRDFDVAVVQVIQRWAARSPADAAGWVASFQPGAVRETGIKFIAERWLPADAPAAFRWFDSLKDTQFRKETARAIEGIILQQPPDTRVAWLQHSDASIQGELEQQREEAMKDMGDNIPTPTE